MTTIFPVCAECGRTFIHAMTCSTYAGAAPLEPTAVDAPPHMFEAAFAGSLRCACGAWSNEGNHIRTEAGALAPPEPAPKAKRGRRKVVVPEIPGPDGTTQLALMDGEILPAGFPDENEIDDTVEEEVPEETPEAIGGVPMPHLKVAAIRATASPLLADRGPEKSATFDHNCTLCPLHGRATTVCVAGEGPTDAAIMLVGQNPGAEEDREGFPFIGPAGKLLDQYLTAAGLDRADVFISNAVKCITTNNRTPSKKEMAACSTYIVNEIVMVQPQVVVILGNIPLQALVGITGITKERGKQQRFSDHIRNGLRTAGVSDAYEPYILPTIHPAAVLQSPRGAAYAATIIEDLRLAAAQISGAFAEIPVPWAYLDTLTPEVVRQRMKAIEGTRYDDGANAYDIETNALPIWDPAFRVRMLAVDSGNDPVSVFRGQAVLAGIAGLEAMHAHGARLVGHNAAGYDRPGIEARTGVNLRNSDDTMLMAHLLDEEGPKKLEDLCVRRLHVRPWKDEVTWSWTDGPQTDEEWQRAGLYNARDARYTRLLDENLRTELEADPALAKYYHTLFLPLARAFSVVERNGVTMSLDKIGYAIGEFTMQKIKAEAQVRRVVGDDKFNPGSSKQVREFLFTRLNLPVQDWTDAEASTNELALKKLRALVDDAGVSGEDPVIVNPQLDFIEGELAYREATKMLGTYLEKYAKNVLDSPDSRIHFWYSMISAVSRSSSDGQQIPQDPRIRDCVSAPEGTALVQADFAQMELRIAAHLSQDPELLRVYRAGGDIHRATASAITGKLEHEITKKERDDAKPWSFSLLYGADEYTIESILLKNYDIISPRYETTRTRNAFHDRYSGLQTWYNAVWQEVRASGQVRTLTGRVRRLPAIYSTDDYKRLEAFRQAINFTDQALGFDIAGIGLILAIGMGLKVTWFLHDALYIECPRAEVEDVTAKIKQIETAIPEMLDSMFGIKFSVPLPMDVTVK